MPADKRKHIDNGIFLCGSCHDMIDKRGSYADESGVSVETLREWRSNHYRIVDDALNGAYDLFSLARRQTKQSVDARMLIEEMNKHAAFFAPVYDEDWTHVISSFKRFRSTIGTLLVTTLPDDPIYSACCEIDAALRLFMNRIKTKNGQAVDELDAQTCLLGVRIAIKPHIRQLSRIAGRSVPANLA
ncbi:hypothetical protein GC088_03200 [Arthrobacter sp. JZ12]|uniref:hypothetical protein n=1 Tax=Arthrobacter sp. JZ12 TaxID=2654190 RepID=UPI002B481273|nr:hypothetical protein [Arthrobacter sp. JZ12]WRH24200.1 hypothetical protein GC088_03200 [Arthrobacter sp. JZ12]